MEAVEACRSALQEGSCREALCQLMLPAASPFGSPQTIHAETMLSPVMEHGGGTGGGEGWWVVEPGHSLPMRTP